MKVSSRRASFATAALVVLAACAAVGAGAPAPGGAAGDYCRSKGGVVQLRTPTFGTNNTTTLALSGPVAFCRFSGGGSRIYVDLGTLVATRPTLAALAYLEKPPTPRSPNGNPASVYCSRIGGSDQFGGVNAAGGGWVLRSAGVDRVVQACVFPDRSIIDSWGLAYHANGVIRGKDLTTILRYRPESPPAVFG